MKIKTLDELLTGIKALNQHGRELTERRHWLVQLIETIEVEEQKRVKTLRYLMHMHAPTMGQQ